MNRVVSSIGAQASTEPPPFRVKHFKRIVRLVCRNRGLLALGMLSTVVFACLHTISIGAAFPVFRILLEEEGLHSWVNRTVASQRLDMSIGVPTEDGSARITKIDSKSRTYAKGLRVGSLITDVQNRHVSELFRELAHGAVGSTVTVQTSLDSRTTEVQLELGELGWSMVSLRWSASLLGTNADTQRLETLKLLLFGLIGLVVAANVFRYIGEVLMARAVLEAMMQLRGDLYERTLHLPISFFAGQPTADLVGRFVQDIQEVQRGMLTLLSKFTREPLRAMFVLGLCLTLDWRMTLALLIVAPVTGLMFWRVGKRVKRSNRRLLQGYGEMIGALTASLQNLRVVKAYTAENHERERLKAVDRRVLRQQLSLAKLQAFVSPAMETVVVVAVSFLTLWLASRVLSHQMSISEFATLGLALAMVFDPLRKLTDVYVRVQRSTAGAERIFRILDHPVESEAKSGEIDLDELKGNIEFRNVCFTYSGADTPALKNVSLKIVKGETIALVGPNGCGKTTLISMIPRLLNPDSGSVLFDGVDLATSTLRSLRKQIGLVTQDAVVFAGTPIENIAYGQSEIDEDAVRDAARRASAEEFIEKIPGGFHAILAERGTSLSGGQRQRLAIARAIFRDAPILIFDEATSQVDSQSEWKIQKALQKFAEDRTTIIIAHRLSTIQFADRIVVMDNGRILDMGSKDELFDRCPLFRTLCETQGDDTPKKTDHGLDEAVQEHSS